MADQPLAAIGIPGIGIGRVRVVGVHAHREHGIVKFILRLVLRYDIISADFRRRKRERHSCRYIHDTRRIVIVKFQFDVLSRSVRSKSIRILPIHAESCARQIIGRRKSVFRIFELSGRIKFIKSIIQRSRIRLNLIIHRSRIRRTAVNAAVGRIGSGTVVSGTVIAAGKRHQSTGKKQCRPHQ